MTDDNTTTPPPQPIKPVMPAPPVVQPSQVIISPRRVSVIHAIVTAVITLVFFASITLNIILLVVMAGQRTAPSVLEQTVIQNGNDKQIVAVYELSGVIGKAAADRFAVFCREIAKNGNIKAVVLRVDSPGGDASASDRIHALFDDLRVNHEKTLVVSMGGTAASGGYYVSVPADWIIAEPTTATGSIGVIMGWVVVKGTLEKIGMETIVLKSTDAEAWKAVMTPFEHPAPYQRQYLMNILNTIQQRFNTVVREGRGDRLKPHEETYTVTVGEGDKARTVTRTTQAPFNGKVYLADEAMELGLIDEIGYANDAYDTAAELAKLDDPKVVQYKPSEGLLKSLLAGPSESLKVDANLLDKLQTPKIMLIWKAE